MHNTVIRGLPVLEGVQHCEIKITELVRADANEFLITLVTFQT